VRIGGGGLQYISNRRKLGTEGDEILPGFEHAVKLYIN